MKIDRFEISFQVEQLQGARNKSNNIQFCAPRVWALLKGSKNAVRSIIPFRTEGPLHSATAILINAERYQFRGRTSRSEREKGYIRGISRGFSSARLYMLQRMDPPFLLLSISRLLDRDKFPSEPVCVYSFLIRIKHAWILILFLAPRYSKPDDGNFNWKRCFFNLSKCVTRNFCCGLLALSIFFFTWSIHVRKFIIEIVS